MDENITTIVGVENPATTTDANTNPVTDGVAVTYTQTDFDVKLQSETDKVRTKYSKQIKELQGKIDELTPVTKTEEQLAFEKRVVDLETKQKEIETKERLINLQSALHSKNLDISLADYIKADTNLEKFEAVINQMITDRTKASGFVPTTHQPNPTMTRDEWNALGYFKQSELFKTNPELANAFINN